MKLIIIIAALLALISVPIIAQECGPGCPTCSGSGNSSGTLIEPGSFSMTYLFIPDGEEETGILNLRAGLTSWMDGGIGYAFKGEKAVWNLRIQAIRELESNWRPAILIGSGSVQTGESDQSLYLQVVKTLALNEELSLRLSAGAACLIPDFDKVFGLAGASISYRESLSTFINYDGKSMHPGISWNPNEWLNVVGLMIETESPAVLVGFRYSIE